MGPCQATQPRLFLYHEGHPHPLLVPFVSFVVNSSPPTTSSGLGLARSAVPRRPGAGPNGCRFKRHKYTRFRRLRKAQHPRNRAGLPPGSTAGYVAPQVWGGIRGNEMPHRAPLPSHRSPAPAVFDKRNVLGYTRFWHKARGAVAQLGERINRTDEARGSNPLSSTCRLSATSETWARSAAWERVSMALRRSRVRVPPGPPEQGVGPNPLRLGRRGFVIQGRGVVRRGLWTRSSQQNWGRSTPT